MEDYTDEKVSLQITPFITPEVTVSEPTNRSLLCSATGWSKDYLTAGQVRNIGGPLTQNSLTEMTVEELADCRRSFLLYRDV
jgi:hypothetical protein